MDYRTITFGKKTVAIVCTQSVRVQGIKFLSKPKFSLQVGLMEHPAGKVIRDHRHNLEKSYQINTAQEFLYVESGKVEVHLFTEKWKPVEDLILGAGDFILIVSGGHGFNILEDARMIEVKQGPFPGNKLLKFFRDEET